MEDLPKGNYLKYKPNQLQGVRELYNLESPGRIKEAVDVLIDWVQKQEHFRKKDFSKEYLEILLIITKGSVEAAKARLEKLCTFRTIWPEFFNKTDISSVRTETEEWTFLPLPEMTDEFSRVCIIKFKKTPHLTGDRMVEYIKNSIIIYEYLRKYDYPSGFTFIYDYREINLMDYVGVMTPTQLSQMMTLYMEGYGGRIKGIHILSSSKLSDAAMLFFKQVWSKKLTDRMHVHKSLDTLFEFVPKKIMPADYGGEAPPLDELFDAFVKELSSKEHIEYVKEMRDASTDESKRSKDVFNENYSGMPGSFRTLSVD